MLACNILFPQNTKSKASKVHSTPSPDDKILSKAIELKFHTKAGGSNGASVVWHPLQKKYYAAMAGNAEFPLEIYDETGNSLTDTNLTSMFDVRGFWYNSRDKKIQGNAYNDFGWIEYMTDENGLNVYMRKLFSGMKQPEAQSSGAYDEKNNAVYFFDNVNLLGVEKRNLKTGAIDTTFILHYGSRTKEEIKLEEEFDLGEKYNSSALGFTGISGSEIALLNAFDMQIEFYNLTNGLMTKILRLPGDAPAELALNFCYSNGIFWLFDKSGRKWLGYK
jgi:hypothetical protein